MHGIFTHNSKYFFSLEIHTRGRRQMPYSIAVVLESCVINWHRYIDTWYKKAHAPIPLRAQTFSCTSNSESALSSIGNINTPSGVGTNTQRGEG